LSQYSQFGRSCSAMAASLALNQMHHRKSRARFE
jgi:hypothetical protein